jgi:ferritin-like metal-binding protein YciE
MQKSTKRSQEVSTIKTMHESFLHELSDTYDAEKQFTQAMQKMLSMAQNPQVKQGLQQHIGETEQQIKNLDQVFSSLGASPEKISCKGAAGIVNEFTSTASDVKAQELLDGFIVGAGLKGEHYEIATYRCLVEKANLMKHTDAARLLQENLKMEEAFAHKLEQLDQQLGKTLVQQKPELVGHEV